jgi:hypothetical protein
MNQRDSTNACTMDRPVRMDGARAIVIEQVIEPQRSATVAEALARILLRWRPALAIAIVAVGAAGYWEARGSGRLQSVSFTVVRPTCDTPSVPGAADIAKALNSIPTREWNVGGGHGRFEARSDKATNGVELTFTPASADESTPALCRTEAERLIGGFNALVDPDLQRAKATLEATILALDTSIAEVSALAKDRSGAGGNSDAVLLARQASEMRERQASQRVARDAIRGARLLGNETDTRSAALASAPVTALLVGCIAFVAALFLLDFGASVAAAYRAAVIRST